MDRSLNGKVIVITGASSGFGKGAALEFARLGASVVLAARRKDLLDELALECGSVGGVALAVETDVGCHSQVQKLHQETMDKFGRIDVWINNAGAAAVGRFSEVPLDDHLKVIDVDLKGTLAGSYFALREFLAQGFGTLINVASMIGKIPAPYYSSYSAAKHGMVGLDGSLRQELAELKVDKTIRVCSVLPMAMDTPFFEHSANYTGKKSVPIPPLSDADDVVKVLVDLVFDPKPEVTVGKGSGVFSFSDAVAPGLTEDLMAKNAHQAQIEKAPPAPPTKGNLTQSSSRGADVHHKY